MRADVSIEFAHVYVDEEIQPEHRTSSGLMVDARSSLVSRGQCVSTVILVDDYNPQEDVLDIDSFLAALEESGGGADWVLSEAGLVPAAEEFVGSLTPREQRGHLRYARSSGKFACSLLVASLYLVRLGALEVPPDATLRAGPGEVPLVADALHNLLHERFHGAERRAARLLQASPFADLLGQIVDVFHDDVAVAAQPEPTVA